MTKRLMQISMVCVLGAVASCNNMPSQSRGPIVLGDSSTIVTERDPARLEDMVTDLNPVIKSSEPKDTVAAAKPEPEAVAAKPADTPKKSPLLTPPKIATAVAQPSTLSGNGLKADFNIASFLIPGVTGKLAGKGDLSKASGAVFTWQSGPVSGNLVKVTANVTKVSQRYQTIVVLKNELGMLPLESLSVTTSWEALKGANNIYKITGLDERNLKFPDADRGDIQEAVAKAARRHHMSRKKQQEWEHSVRNVRAANQKPLNVMLRSVMWKIDGKDADGKAFSKQIRVDMPI